MMLLKKSLVEKREKCLQDPGAVHGTGEIKEKTDRYVKQLHQHYTTFKSPLHFSIVVVVLIMCVYSIFAQVTYYAWSKK